MDSTLHSIPIEHPILRKYQSKKWYNGRSLVLAKQTTPTFMYRIIIIIIPTIVMYISGVAMTTRGTNINYAKTTPGDRRTQHSVCLPRSHSGTGRKHRPLFAGFFPSFCPNWTFFFFPDWFMLMEAKCNGRRNPSLEAAGWQISYKRGGLPICLWLLSIL